MFSVNRDWEINAFKLKLIHYHQWFSPAMKFLLDGFVALIRQVMERAVEDDYNEVRKKSVKELLYFILCFIKRLFLKKMLFFILNPLWLQQVYV